MENTEATPAPASRRLPPPFDTLVEGDTPLYTGSEVLRLLRFYDGVIKHNQKLSQLVVKQQKFIKRHVESNYVPPVSEGTSDGTSTSQDLAKLPIPAPNLVETSAGKKNNPNNSLERQKSTRLSDIYDHYSGKPDSMSSETYAEASPLPINVSSTSTTKDALRLQPKALGRQNMPSTASNPSTPSPTQLTMLSEQKHTPQAPVKLMPSESSPFTRPWPEKAHDSDKRAQTAHDNGGNVRRGDAAASGRTEKLSGNDNKIGIPIPSAIAAAAANTTNPGPAMGSSNQNTHDALLRLENKNAPKVKPNMAPLGPTKTANEKRGLRLSRSANAIRDMVTGYISPTQSRFPQHSYPSKPQSDVQGSRYNQGIDQSLDSFCGIRENAVDSGLAQSQLSNTRSLQNQKQGIMATSHAESKHKAKGTSRSHERIDFPVVSSPKEHDAHETSPPATKVGSFSVANGSSIHSAVPSHTNSGTSGYYLNPKLQPFALPIGNLSIQSPTHPGTMHAKSTSNPESKHIKDASISSMIAQPVQPHQLEAKQDTPPPQQQHNNQVKSSPMNPPIKATNASDLSPPHLPTNDSIYSLGESYRERSATNQSFPSLRESVAGNGERQSLVSLSNVDVEVTTSQVELDKRGSKVITFLINVVEFKESDSISFAEALAEPQRKTLWVLKKLYSDFLTLDQEIRKWRDNGTDVQTLPDMSVFKKAPSKEYRKNLLEDYLKWAIRTAQECDSLLKFLSTNIIDAYKTLYHTEGYLSKTGRNLGGVKKRYYVCNAEEKTLEYYDKPGGSRSGVISLDGAVVKTERQSSSDPHHRRGIDTKLSKNFRHAFLIEEKPKRLAREPSTHVLKASSDAERDVWVAVIGNIIRSVSEKPNAHERKPIFKRLRPSLSKSTKDGPDGDVAAQPLRIGGSHGGSNTNKEQSGNSSQTKKRSGSRPRSLSYPPPQLGVSDKREPKNGDSKWNPKKPNSNNTAESQIVPEIPQRDGHRSHSSLTSLNNHEQSDGYISPAGRSPLSAPHNITNQEEADHRSLSNPTSPRSPENVEHNVHTESNSSGFVMKGVRPKTAAPLRYNEISPNISGHLENQQGIHMTDQGAQKKVAPLEQLLQGKTMTGKPIQEGFHKDSIGRIRRDIKGETQQLTKIETPHVTDDILGIGRRKQDKTSESMALITRSKDNKLVVAAEEKKRGRLNLMWNRNKKNQKPQKNVSNQGSNDPLVQHKAPMMPVFGLVLELAVQATKVKEYYELPAVVYRCIEYLDAKKAFMEEGIYRLSGSNLEIDKLKSKFNTKRDFNILKSSEVYDVHVVAGLLKLYLRELPTSVLTPALHHDFVRVIDLADRDERVHEMGRLVSDLPLANYTILRALIAHLIRVVQHEKVNKMSLYGIGIVISPSIGIPVGVFNLLMSEFEYIFWVNDEGEPSPKRISGSLVKSSKGKLEARPSTEPALRSPQVNLQDQGQRESNGWDDTSDSSDGSDIEDQEVEKMYQHDHRKARQTRRIEGVPFSIGNGQWPTFDENVENFEEFCQRIAEQHNHEEVLDEAIEGETDENGNIQDPSSMITRICSDNPQDGYLLKEERNGRTNRNSRQYAVGAPGEMLDRESNLRLPNEADRDSIDDVDDIILSHRPGQPHK
ncbi:Rho GTPase activating protein [Mycoemilia scoparia]|uniref:Rho GTPase activating protein n=1 Tax=Mycoemilia scoparia TaxID=417184 RepID=A0A9W8A369_9FUNG|nr:Rho GTPase activating protein [Mycoemilia scoparia]